MLILSRKPNESFLIRVGDETIRVIVNAVRGDRVRVGVEAAPHVEVLRGELEPRWKRRVAGTMEDVVSDAMQ